MQNLSSLGLFPKFSPKMGKGQAFDKMGLTGLKMSSKLGSKGFKYTNLTPGTWIWAQMRLLYTFGLC